MAEHGFIGSIAQRVAMSRRREYPCGLERFWPKHLRNAHPDYLL